MMRTIIPVSVFAITAAAQSTAGIYAAGYSNVTWDNNGWIIQTTSLDPGRYQTRMSLANGYFGINLAAAGPFFEVDSSPEGDILNGWPIFDRRQTFGTVAGFYDVQATTNGTNYEWLNQYGGESVISGLPHWAGIILQAGGSTLNASVNVASISNFSSSMDHKRALLSWSYTWTTGNCQLGVQYSMFVNKLYVNRAAVRVNVTPQGNDCDVTFLDLFQGDAAVRTDFADKGSEGNATIWSAVRPKGINNVTAYTYSTLVGSGPLSSAARSLVSDVQQIGGNQSGIAQSLSGRLTAGTTTTLTKYIGVASTDAFADPQSVARDASAAGAASGWTSQFAAHTGEWASILTSDSVDDYSLSTGSLPNDPNIVHLQVTSVTNIFNLLQNTVGPNAVSMSNAARSLDDNSISVCGLGSACYAGLIFWDAEVWMAPGISTSHPRSVRQIPNYRVAKYNQAQENIKTAYQSSQNATGQFTGGAVFPWTSGRFGNCTGTGPCFDYEYHINGDIGLTMYNELVTSGDTEYFKESLFPIFDSIAYFYSELLSHNSTLNAWTILNATDPDEYANNKDDPGFTLVLVKTHLMRANQFRSEFGLPINSTWASQAESILIPVNTDANIIVEYNGMNGLVEVKQADVVLIDDLLDYPNPYSLSNLDYYASKQSINGPGMTYGVFSIVANEVSPSGCSSYTYQLYGSEPYARAPWFQYSEQVLDDYTENGGTHAAFPFLTGMGGANRVAVFGYLGLRLMVDALNVDPALPPQITNLKYRTIYWQGHAIQAVSNQTYTTLTRTGYSLPGANSTYANAAIPVTIGMTNRTLQLPVNGSIVLENRRTGWIKTVPGNVAQCQPATTEQGFLPGQFPIAAVDGAVSTKWQPEFANVTSSITVQLPDTYVRISGFAFDWAQEPPARFSVAFSNQSDFSPSSVLNVTSDSVVSISSPFNQTLDAMITPYMSNTTNITLANPVWSARYARLSIFGNLKDSASSEPGASVAEWAIIAEGGSKVAASAPSVQRREPSVRWRREWGPRPAI